MSRAVYHIGHTLDVVRSLPDASVDLVLTSPPFLALRSYLPADDPAKVHEIGQEATPASFVDTLLALSAEWRRVLAPHGSIAIELGDTYSGVGGTSSAPNPAYGEARSMERKQGDMLGAGKGWRKAADLKEWPLAKSLALVPELYRVGLAYGINPLTGQPSPAGRWRVRNVVRWHRPNPPVGALGDKYRPATTDMVVACTSDKRWFDLDAVRTEHVTPDAVTRPRANYRRSADDPGVSTNTGGNPAGAPPLDTWIIPTEPYVTPAGLLVMPSGGTAHRVRVEVGAPADDIRRTTSPDCPVHASQDRPGSTRRCGEREADSSTSTAHTDGHHVRVRAVGSPTTPSTHAPTVSGEVPGDLAATGRNTPANRTAHVPATTPAGTPSARTGRHTAGTPDEPELFAQHPDNFASSTDEACRPAGALGTPSRTSDTSDPSSACTCSYWVEIDVAAESTSDYATWPDDTWIISTEAFRGAHYATWPRALCVRPIESMCPRRVCTVCGQPSRRIVEKSEEYEAFRRRKLAQIDSGVTSDRDQAIRPTVFTNAGTAMNAEYVTTGWSDCECPGGPERWRNGVVLDPFAGSGTTLAVATGCGRDAIGIDLDIRNADLARERIGMFMEIA